MLQDVASTTDLASIQRELVQDMAQRAIARAIEEPVPAGSVAPRHAELTASSGNPVAEAKSDLMSTIARPGTETGVGPSSAAEPAEDPMEKVTERIKGLYVELTEYHVAWKVGHKVQQDISQILRGQ